MDKNYYGIDFNSNEIALMDSSFSVSYTHLYKLILDYHEFFEHNKYRKVALYSKNSIKWCVCYLSCFFANILILPVSRNNTEKECLELCQKLGVNVLFSDEPLKHTELEYITFQDFFVYRVTEEQTVDPELNEVSTVIYTSGTNGRKKGVMLTASNIYSNVCSITDYLNCNANDRILIAKPLTHASTITGELLTGIFSNSTIYLYTENNFNAKKIIRILNNEGITVFFGVPTMFALIEKYSHMYRGALRTVSVSGCYSDPELLKNMHGIFKCNIYHVYGLTEASPRLTVLEPDNSMSKLGSVGKPLNNVMIRIVDELGKEIQESNGIGEIIAKGPNIMKGYYSDSKLSQETVQNGWLHTGDQGFFDEDGFLYLCGRQDDMISRGGINLWPDPIEDAIKELSGVKDVVVCGIEDYFYSHKIVAFLVTEHSVSYEDILTQCYDKKVTPPDKVEIVESIPRNEMGKIQRSLIKKEYKNKVEGDYNERNLCGRRGQTV